MTRIFIDSRNAEVEYDSLLPSARIAPALLVSTSRADWNMIDPVRASYIDDAHSVVIPAFTEPSFTEVFERITAEIAARRPCVALLPGDRYEMVAAAMACSLAGVPVVHLAAGDRTEGAKDDRYRMAITALSDRLLTTNNAATERLFAMRYTNVRQTGSPAIDAILGARVLDRKQWAQELGGLIYGVYADDPRHRLPIVLACCHPETAADDPLAACRAMIDALSDMDVIVVATASNTDPGGAECTEMMRAATRRRKHWFFYENMGLDLYANAMRHAAVMVGNSSSGYYEAPVFGLPVVDIGGRQRGRTAAVCVMGGVEPDAAHVRNALEQGLGFARNHGRHDPEFPYGDGSAAPRVAAILREYADRSRQDGRAKG